MAKLKHSTKGLVSFEEEVAAMEEGEEVEENQAENDMTRMLTARESPCDTLAEKLAETPERGSQLE
jgi:hypothetical protein